MMISCRFSCDGKIGPLIMWRAGREILKQVNALFLALRVVMMGLLVKALGLYKAQCQAHK